MWWQLLFLAFLAALSKLIPPVVPAPDKHIMASKTATHQRSNSKKPSPKQKPSFLQSEPVSPMEPDFLKDDEDFLREDIDPPLPLPLKLQETPRVIEKQSNNSTVDRLVIAIDYGTTFTGKPRVKKFKRLTNKMQASAMPPQHRPEQSWMMSKCLLNGGREWQAHRKYLAYIRTLRPRRMNNNGEIV
jgi:hypothetical protein